MSGVTIPGLDSSESGLARWLRFCQSGGKMRATGISILLITLIAFADYRYTASLAVLYILPMVLASTVLAPVEITLLALVCAVLRWAFDVNASFLEHGLRFAFATAAYSITGLFTMVLIRNRQQVLAHVNEIMHEQALRKSAEEQLRLLVDSSPAGILTLNQKGVVIAANRAATVLFAIEENDRLQGQSIRDYLPLLHDALHLDIGADPFRTAAQCQGRRHSGEIFLAHTWFSTYTAAGSRHLAAIVVDASEEMREREEQKFRQLSASSRVMAAAASHEIRNLCNGIGFIYSSLKENPGLAHDQGFQALGALVKGLEGMASRDLHLRVQETVECIQLRRVLDNLRIVIEPDWDDVDGAIRWDLQPDLPEVLADSNGLLQALLNLARNSHRAVQNQTVRELTISVTVRGERAAIRVRDSGPGVAHPEDLFQPFQKGALSSGLGLYISRAILRSYGGDLRFEPASQGSCFTIELQVASGGAGHDSAFSKN